MRGLSSQERRALWLLLQHQVVWVWTNGPTRPVGRTIEIGDPWSPGDVVTTWIRAELDRRGVQDERAVAALVAQHGFNYTPPASPSRSRKAAAR